VEFDEDNLLVDAGLVPVMALAEKAGLGELVDERVRIVGAKNAAGANAGAKVTSIVAGMVAGADSFDDLDRLRAGAAGKMFTAVRAPSTLGSFARAFTHGHNQQLEGVFRDVTAVLVREAGMLPGAGQFAFVDIDSLHLETFGYAKQGAVNGRLKGKKTLHPLIATISTPLSRPVVAGVRMRRGNAADVRGAARFTAQTLRQARACGATGMIVLRADSKFYSAKVVAAALRHGAQVSITTGSNPAVNAAIDDYTSRHENEPGGGWTPIHYPNAFVDTETGELVSDAEVAQMPFTAFTSKPKNQQVTGRLIVRRVKRLNPAGKDDGRQLTLFDTWRHHAVFVTGTIEMLQAEAHHRAHAVQEQINADAKASALAHAPSGIFQANAAWATCWAIAHNLTRAAGHLASGNHDGYHARATTPTIRATLINVPARTAKKSRRIVLHGPRNWRHRDAFTQLLETVSARAPSTT
jgi:hypothetical protein